MRYYFRLLAAYGKVLSFYRLFFTLRTFFLYYLLVWFRVPFRHPRPYAVSIELSAGCNLKCPGCETGLGLVSKGKRLLTFAEFCSIVEQLPKSVFHLTLHFQGEPLLNPEIFQMIAFAVQRKFFVSFSTNGLLLNKQKCYELVEAGLPHMIISVDGFDNDSYAKYRVGGNFDGLLSNIRQLLEIRNSNHKSGLLIEMQTVLLSYNENHLDKFKAIKKSTGVDKLTYKTAYSPSLNEIPDYLPKRRKMLRYTISENGTLLPKRKLRNHCFRMLTNPVITVNQEVLPCCYDKNTQHILGNLKVEKFTDIIVEEKYRQFIKSVHTKRKANSMCCNCV